MNRKRTALLPTLLVPLTACASGAAPSPASPTGAMSGPAAQTEAPARPATTTAASGSATFSAAQADRGRDVFRAQCTECHYSSEFSDAQFQFKWSRRNAGALYQLIQTQMPETTPGSLLPEEAVDIVAYILRMNGFEPGAGELAPDRQVLDAISLASIRNELERP